MDRLEAMFIFSPSFRMNEYLHTSLGGGSTECITQFSGNSTRVRMSNLFRGDNSMEEELLAYCE